MCRDIQFLSTDHFNKTGTLRALLCIDKARQTKNIDGVTNKDNVSVYSVCSIKVLATNSEKITPFSEDDGFIVCNAKAAAF